MVAAYQCIQSGRSDGPNRTWGTNSRFFLDDEVLVGGNLYRCVQGGVSGTSAPSGTNPAHYATIYSGSTGWLYIGTYGPTGTGSSIVDNGCIWKYVGEANATQGGASDTSQQSGIPYVMPTTVYLMNIPDLGISTDTGGFYVGAGPSYGAGGSYAVWNGCIIFRSTDRVNWSQWKTINHEMPIGTVQGKVNGPITGWEGWDNDTSIEVIWNSDYGFQSASDLNVLNGQNLLLVGNELIQFANVTYDDGTTNMTTFSRLLRGRQGTDQFIWTHTPGETVYVLGSNYVNYVSGVAERGLTRYYKAVSIGASGGTQDITPFINSSAGLKPFSPVQIKASIDGSGNRTISWFRRNREQGQWANNIDVPLIESTETYDIEFWNNGAVVRTISAVSNSDPTQQPTLTYSAANYAADYPSGLKTNLIVADPGGETQDWTDWVTYNGSWSVGVDGSFNVSPNTGNGMFISSPDNPTFTSTFTGTTTNGSTTITYTPAD